MTDSDILSIKQRFGIIGNSPLLNHAVQVAAQVAPTDMTVLITGESGVGKESFSKIIHQLSHRKHGQLIAINCGAIPEGTIDSELFGHEKGSFTGAHEARKGYFEVTNGGTIFLDEIGEMPLGTQARLLRVLENGEFIKVGSSKVQKTDVRVVAATNVDLYKAVERRKFREDLYYRLNTVPIYVPALRERSSDVYLLFRKFSEDFSEKYKVIPIRLDDAARDLLLRALFPGNIRQLKNITEQMSVLEMNRVITAEVLRNYLPNESREGRFPATVGYAGDAEMTEREILYKILFDLKRDFTELKKFVFDALKNGSISQEVLKEKEEYFKNDIHSEKIEMSSISPYLLPHAVHDGEHEVEKTEDIAHETEDESLSLNDKEKEMIIKALRKNKNKRKYAARDLEISERTLYRKIKQYNIQDF